MYTNNYYGVNMVKPTFTRKVVFNRGSLQVNIPAEIVGALDLKKGDKLVIYLESNKIICQKAFAVDTRSAQ